MPWICRLAWILGAFLILATLDRVPDPPAANPNGSQMSVSAIHGIAPVAVSARAGAPPQSALKRIAANEVFESLVYGDLTVRVQHATDSSPPARRA